MHSSPLSGAYPCTILDYIVVYSKSHPIFLSCPCISYLSNRHWMEVSPHHTMAGEICGFFTWLWVFYRAKHDLPVVLGLRHPWEHGEDPWAIHDHVDNLEELQNDWEEFADKSTRPGEDDDDDDDDDGELILCYLFMLSSEIFHY